ncbi:unnamed protein product [Blepharisma stoltei]|uniref:Uncharacterized protein n=1 Tax=Blepharisma stoltei TaxID=1481888 RepID=A0AAU9K4N6_9CILI|nr:unnamed protein product [Blepharisma stoltei]
MIKLQNPKNIDSLEEEQKILHKALILASLDLREAKSRVEELKIENDSIKRNIPSLLLPEPEIDLPELLTTLQPKLYELREAIMVQKVRKAKLAKEVEEIKDKCNRKEVELKGLKRRQQIQKKGSYFIKHQIKKSFVGQPKEEENN